MDLKTKNICPRCSRERVIKRSYTELIGSTNVTCIDMVCPDKACQKLTDEQSKARIEKQNFLKERSKNKAAAKTEAKA